MSVIAVSNITNKRLILPNFRHFGSEVLLTAFFLTI